MATKIALRDDDEHHDKHECMCYPEFYPVFNKKSILSAEYSASRIRIAGSLTVPQRGLIRMLCCEGISLLQF